MPSTSLPPLTSITSHYIPIHTVHTLHTYSHISFVIRSVLYCYYYYYCYYLPLDRAYEPITLLRSGITTVYTVQYGGTEVQYSTVPPHLKHHIRLTSNTEANRTSFCFYLPLPPPSPPSPHTTHLTKQPQLQLLASYNFATAIVVLSVLSATHRATHPHKPSFCDRPPRNCCPSHPSKTIQYAMRRLKIELQ